MADRKSLFQEVALGSANQMLDELLPYRGERLWNHNGEAKRWLFRGQSDADWGLTPAAMRPGTLTRYEFARVTPIDRKILPVEHRLKDEAWVVWRFAAGADRAGLPFPGDTPELRTEADDPSPYEFPPIRHRGMYALAQHYRVPTRLLDWTPRPFVAAYFAAVGAAEQNVPYKQRNNLPDRKSDRCAIWALSQQALGRYVKDSDPTVAVVTAPAALVPNLAAQAGQFTLVHYVSDDRAEKEDPPDLDDLFRHEERPDDEALRWAPVLYKFTFPAKEAGRLLYLLHLLDINAATVRPGFDGVEQAMFEEMLMPRPAFRDD